MLAHNAYKYCELKRAGYFVRNFSIVGPVGSSEVVIQELKRLRKCSEKNNIDEVNVIVKSLLSNPDFWIHCYESIRSNPGALSPGKSSFTGKTVTLDGISLEFFHKLSIILSRGRFQFGSIRRVDIPKRQGGNRLLGIADSRDKIVQKGMAVIFETLCEHRFHECSFGARRRKPIHDVLAYITKKVPSGM